MRWELGTLLLALLLGVGAAGGFAASSLGEGPPAADGPGVPLPAASPSIPVDPAPELVPDPDVPPLERDLRTRMQEVGAGGFEVTVPGPAGWNRSRSDLNEFMWLRPGNPSYTYVLRIEITRTEHSSLEEMVEERIEDLQADEEHLVVVDRGTGSLEFTYVDAGHLRHAFVTWLDLSGSGEAEVEVALTGREVDVPGMRDLLARIVADTRA